MNDESQNDGSTKPDVPSVAGESRNLDGTFKKGFSGNPGGRVSVSITTEIRKVMLEVLDDPEIPNEEKKTALQLVVRKILKNAIAKEDEKSLAKIWAYIDGLPKGSFELGFDREGLAELTEFMKALANPNDPTRPKSS